ncbi:hypothetical protein SSX86_020262 [Deinandra increscens subsp. villosa]|uniref:Uncharacterized protein n=1 Tax=Deinandra increscens subsp. villosa TaxID=3103831 RepID=A0AAP0CUG4_9ASTR
MKTISEDGASSGGSRLSNPMMIVHEDECNSSGSSSIGDDSDREDIESRYTYHHHHHHPDGKGGFDDAIQALEQALPIRRGISTFYNGKSKSFTCLTKVWPTASVQDITKAENSYTRKRRNLGAFRLSYFNTRRGRIQKKHKTAKMHFTIGSKDPEFANRSLALRSFSMVDLHQTKIRNC